ISVAVCLVCISLDCGHMVGQLGLLFSSTNTAPTVIYTLSLHDALPILTPPLRSSTSPVPDFHCRATAAWRSAVCTPPRPWQWKRSEEHTSELQSRENLVCRLLLEKKKTHPHTQRMTLTQSHPKTNIYNT